MPVGCGTVSSLDEAFALSKDRNKALMVQWPAFWTVVDDEWPVGGEIDIIEGDNGAPTLISIAWNASSSAEITTPLTGFPLT